MPLDTFVYKYLLGIFAQFFWVYMKGGSSDPIVVLCLTFEDQPQQLCEFGTLVYLISKLEFFECKDVSRLLSQGLLVSLVVCR